MNKTLRETMQEYSTIDVSNTKLGWGGVDKIDESILTWEQVEWLRDVNNLSIDFERLMDTPILGILDYGLHDDGEIQQNDFGFIFETKELKNIQFRVYWDNEVECIEDDFACIQVFSHDDDLILDFINKMCVTKAQGEDPDEIRLLNVVTGKKDKHGRICVDVWITSDLEGMVEEFGNHVAQYSDLDIATIDSLENEFREIVKTMDLSEEIEYNENI